MFFLDFEKKVKKRFKNVHKFHKPLNHSAFNTQLLKVSRPTGKSPTSNIDAQKYGQETMQLRTVRDKCL